MYMAPIAIMGTVMGRPYNKLCVMRLKLGEMILALAAAVKNLRNVVRTKRPKYFKADLIKVYVEILGSLRIGTQAI
jgi:hypothetical protein